MKKIEYSQIVRRKLRELKIHLAREFGAEISRKAIKSITNTARDLEIIYIYFNLSKYNYFQKKKT